MGFDNSIGLFAEKKLAIQEGLILELQKSLESLKMTVENQERRLDEKETILITLEKKICKTQMEDAETGMEEDFAADTKSCTIECLKLEVKEQEKRLQKKEARLLNLEKKMDKIPVEDAKNGMEEESEVDKKLCRKCPRRVFKTEKSLLRHVLDKHSN